MTAGSIGIRPNPTIANANEINPNNIAGIKNNRDMSRDDFCFDSGFSMIF